VRTWQGDDRMSLYVKATLPRTRYSHVTPERSYPSAKEGLCPLCRAPMVKGNGWVSCPRIGHYTYVGATDESLRNSSADGHVELSGSLLDANDTEPLDKDRMVCVGG
jgi:hypothetical protein